MKFHISMLSKQKKTINKNLKTVEQKKKIFENTWTGQNMVRLLQWIYLSIRKKIQIYKKKNINKHSSRPWNIVYLGFSQIPFVHTNKHIDVY